MTDEKKPNEKKTPKKKNTKTIKNKQTQVETKTTLLNRMISEAQKTSTLLEGKIRKQVTENKLFQKGLGMFERIKTNTYVEKATQELKQISDKISLKVFQKKT